MTDHRLHIEVQGNEIVVTLPGTNFKVVYHKPPGSPQLMAKWYASRDKHVVEAKRAEFLANAWNLANDKARELRWIK